MEVITQKEAKEQDLKFYFTGKPCLHGHIVERKVSDGHCVVCAKNRQQKYYSENKDHILARNKKWRGENLEYALERDRKYNADNRERRAQKDKEYYSNNKEVISEKGKEYYLSNRERILERNKVYYQENKDMIQTRKRERYAEIPSVKIAQAMRTSLRRSLNLMKEHKENNTYDLLGYHPYELKEHIESLMLPEMTWESYGRTGWTIDHKIPIATFISEGVNDHSIINSFENLIPMWTEHNSSKNNKTLEGWLEWKGKDSEEYKLYSRFL